MLKDLQLTVDLPKLPKISVSEISIFCAVEVAFFILVVPNFKDIYDRIFFYCNLYQNLLEIG